MVQLGTSDRTAFSNTTLNPLASSSVLLSCLHATTCNPLDNRIAAGIIRQFTKEVAAKDHDGVTQLHSATAGTPFAV